MVIIENEFLRVKIDEKGGSLTSLFDKKRNVELLYQPIKESWQGQDVCIFPFVARLVDGKYTNQGKEYFFKNHGLIRYMSGVSYVNKDTALIEFVSDEKTFQRYPFAFRFYSYYHLERNQLSVSYFVFNESSSTMPFMIGGHPAFLLPGEKKEDGFDIEGNYITFTKKEELIRVAQEETCSFNVKDEFYQNTDRIDLGKKMFEKINTYIFKANDISSLTLHKKDGHRITLEKGKTPYLALWSGNSFGNFIAMEPWCGIPDYVNPNRELSKKPGMNFLKPGKKFEFHYSLLVD